MEDKATAVLPSGLMDRMADPKWKERLEACEKFKEVHVHTCKTVVHVYCQC